MENFLIFRICINYSIINGITLVIIDDFVMTDTFNHSFIQCFILFLTGCYFFLHFIFFCHITEDQYYTGNKVFRVNDRCCGISNLVFRSIFGNKYCMISQIYCFAALKCFLYRVFNRFLIL